MATNADDTLTYKGIIENYPYLTEVSEEEYTEGIKRVQTIMDFLLSFIPQDVKDKLGMLSFSATFPEVGLKYFLLDVKRWALANLSINYGFQWYFPYTDSGTITFPYDPNWDKWKYGTVKPMPYRDSTTSDNTNNAIYDEFGNIQSMKMKVKLS